MPELPPHVTQPLLAQRYQLGVALGSGGMGTVFRALDMASGDTVAIKQLRREAIVREPSLHARFAREHEALRTLNHPNIVRVIDAFEVDGDQYLVMEFVSGGSLDVLLATRGTALAPAHAARLCLDLVDGLTRVHRLDIVHRDIKPANVLLAPDGTPRLSDFGVAQLGASGALTAPSAVVGTLNYLCPEALTGARLDARADMWGLGALLFEMLTLSCPFGAGNPGAVLHAIVNAPPLDMEALAPGCPPELIDLTYRLLEKDPAQRIPSARQVGVELELILQSLGSDVGAGSDHPAAIRADHELTGDSDTVVSKDSLTLGLPAELNPFIGRAHEIAAVTQLLAKADTRLITIRGPGGMGKSHLAREVGHRVAAGVVEPDEACAHLSRLPTRVAFVELASLSSPELIVPAIAEVLGVSCYPGTPLKAQLLRVLASKQLVLILDNFEHLLAGAHLVSEIQAAAPGVQVLTTSRECLGLSHEHIVDLRGLHLSTSRLAAGASVHSGILLFQACARRVKPDFDLTPQQALAVARICDLVGGAPLGITLAASWVNTLEPREIAAEIAANFDFLQAELRDLPQRHHSVRAVFEHSWTLLSAEERRVFAALSVFRGGFARSAAQAVSGASLRTLAALLNKSLVVRDPLTGRYSMHELLRQYAAQQLAAEPGAVLHTLDQHSAHYTTLLAGLAARLVGVASTAACDELDSELDNVRVAWATALEHLALGRVRVGLEVLGLFYSAKGYFVEATAVFGAAARALTVLPPARGSEGAQLAALALTLEADAQCEQWQNAEAELPAQKAVALLDERSHPREMAFALFTLAITRYWCAVASGKTNGELEAVEPALALYRGTNDWWRTARALINFGQLVDPTRGEACFLESIALQRANGDQTIVLPGGLIGLGTIKQEQGDRVKARELLVEALSVAEQRKDMPAVCWALERLGILELKAGDWAAAESYSLRRLKLCREFLPFAELACQVTLGEVLLARGMLDDAEQCFIRSLGANESCLDVSTQAITIALAERGLGNLEAQRGQYTRAVLRLTGPVAYFERRQIPWGVVLSADSLGWATFLAGNCVAADELFHRVLHIAVEWHWWPWALSALAGHAWILTRVGEQARAAELAALIHAHPATEQPVRLERGAALLDSLATTLPRSVYDSAVVRGRSLDLATTVRSVLGAHVSP